MQNRPLAGEPVLDSEVHTKCGAGGL